MVILLSNPRRTKVYPNLTILLRSDNRMRESMMILLMVIKVFEEGGNREVKWLVLIHVLSAIIGIGPTFFGHVLVRNNQTLEQLRHSMKLAGKLDFFPKIGGSIAVITGILLISLNNYGSVTQIWILGSLILYVLIQILVIGFAAPAQKRVAQWLFDSANLSKSELPQEQRFHLSRANAMLYAASAMGLVLFVLMIIKPN